MVLYIQIRAEYCVISDRSLDFFERMLLLFAPVKSILHIFLLVGGSLGASSAALGCFGQILIAWFDLVAGSTVLEDCSFPV